MRPRYGSRLAEACERFGIAYDTAAQATRVAAAFESCVRTQDLTFEHHRIVANHPQAGELLEWAAEEGATGYLARDARDLNQFLVSAS